MSLKGKVALVTGASRGIGRGVALRLADAGATVYITSRSPKFASSYRDLPPTPILELVAEEIDERGGKAIPIFVDHSDMTEVRQLFEKIEQQTDGQLDILVNNAFSAVDKVGEMVNKRFWESEPELWDDFNNVGLRNHYYCSVYAARMMTKRRQGLIVNISSAGGLRYLFCVPYGVGKTALDRMAADMAHELRDYGITAVSLWPGMVATERFKPIVESGTFDKSSDPTIASLSKKFKLAETPEFTGLAIAHLAADPKVFSKTGRTLLVADLAIDYQFKDVNGMQPPSLRSVSFIFTNFGFSRLSDYLPHWFRVPGWLLTAINSRL